LAEAAAAAQPHLLGKQFTAADVVIGSGLRWGVKFGLLPERGEFTTYIARLDARPAYARAAAHDARLQKKQEGG
jgi:glutathione S-transferase